MPNVRVIAINNNAGALTTINASIPCRYFEVTEDGLTKQGLTMQTLLDNFSSTQTVATADEPVKFGDVPGISNNQGYILGWPAQNTGGASIAATPLIKVKSATATTTSVRITEYE